MLTFSIKKRYIGMPRPNSCIILQHILCINVESFFSLQFLSTLNSCLSFPFLAKVLLGSLPAICLDTEHVELLISEQQQFFTWLLRLEQLTTQLRQPFPSRVKLYISPSRFIMLSYRKALDLIALVQNVILSVLADEIVASKVPNYLCMMVS